MNPPALPLGSTRGFVAVLATAIVGLTLTVLGLTFTILGDDFATLGGILLAVGLFCASLAAGYRIATRRNDAARTQARTARGTAKVLGADLNGGVRVNGRHPLTLTVKLDGRTVTGTALVHPHQTPALGSLLEVAYDPADPQNFVPV